MTTTPEPPAHFIEEIVADFVTTTTQVQPVYAGLVPTFPPAGSAGPDR